MNKLSVLALSAALALSAPLSASAQDLDLDTDLDVGVEAGADTDNGSVDGDVGVDAGADVDADISLDDDQDIGVDAGAGVDAQAGAEVASDELDEASFAGATAGVQGAAMVDLSDVDATTDIEIVALSTLGDTENMDAFADARANFDSDIAGVSDHVAANADISAALEAEGYTADDVVAVETGANGSVRIYVDDL